MRFDSTEIGNSRIFTKNPIINRKKTVRTKAYKKEHKISGGFISLNNSKDKIICNVPDEQPRTRKKSLFENNNNNNSSEISSKINLLVKIIKIFIKNFILYLKTRADNLLTLQNEFNIQNETSDIMNAVEVSEYEKDLTKHKNVKLNLEYIFDLYFNKYYCLFKYKEIECETNFTELKNIYVITDDFSFSYYIRQIYTYLYYVVPKKEGFYFIYKKDNKKLTIIIKKKVNKNNSKITEEPKDNSMSQIIQTKEMTKEVLYSMSKKLKFVLEIFDNDNNNSNINNNENNNYLSITMPIIKKDKTTEEDEFKDDDINEMIMKSNSLLEEKLKRQLPSTMINNEHKNSNISTIKLVDMISKNGEDKKDNTDSGISFPKNIHFKNENNIINNNLNLFQKNKFMSFKSTPSNDSFLSKCLKISENKKSDKEKSKFKKENQLNINLIQNKINNHSSNKNIFINITNINNSSHKNLKKYTKKKSFVSLKKVYNKNSEKYIKTQGTQQLKGIFTLINKYGYSEVLDNRDKYFSGFSNKMKKLKKNEITFKQQSPTQSFKNKSSYSKGNINQLNLNTRGSGSIVTAFFGKKNLTKSNFFISDIGGENDGKNKLNQNNMIINNLSKNQIKIEYIKEENNIKNSDNLNPSNNNSLKLSKLEEDGKKRNSHNIYPNKSNKDCMTFFKDKKSLNNSNINTINNTLIDNGFSENINLFLEANKERSFHFQKTSKNKCNNINFNSQSDIEQNNEDSEECEENEEFEEGEESFESQEQCKCADLLVVDDEEFNVMASQKMLKNLGFESDKAYNGEECIKLIKDKKELNCKCNRNYYKIIFLDIVMPVMDGIKAAKKIQEMIDNKEINENIKIVFVSGNIDGADLEKSLLEINCVKECLQKPVHISKYKKILEKYYNNNI